MFQMFLLFKLVIISSGELINQATQNRWIHTFCCCRIKTSDFTKVILIHAESEKGEQGSLDCTPSATALLGLRILLHLTYRFMFSFRPQLMSFWVSMWPFWRKTCQCDLGVSWRRKNKKSNKKNFVSMAALNSHDLSTSHDALKADLWAREEKLTLVVGNTAVVLEIIASESYSEKI